MRPKIDLFYTTQQQLSDKIMQANSLNDAAEAKYSPLRTTVNDVLRILKDINDGFVVAYQQINSATTQLNQGAVLALDTLGENIYKNGTPEQMQASADAAKARLQQAVSGVPPTGNAADGAKMRAITMTIQSMVNPLYTKIIDKIPAFGDAAAKVMQQARENAVTDRYAQASRGMEVALAKMKNVNTTLEPMTRQLQTGESELNAAIESGMLFAQELIKSKLYGAIVLEEMSRKAQEAKNEVQRIVDSMVKLS